MHYHIMASTGPQDLADLVAGDSVTVTFDYTSPYTGTVEAVGMAKFGGLVAEDGPVLVTAIVSKQLVRAQAAPNSQRRQWIRLHERDADDLRRRVPRRRSRVTPTHHNRG